jgi:hypothetical protein
MLDVEFVCTVQMGNGKEVRLPFTRSDTWVRGDMADRIAPH